MKHDMITDEELNELLDGGVTVKSADCMSGSRPRRRRVKKSFDDIKARMVMRIYGVTREKAKKIISMRAAEISAAAAAKAAAAAGLVSGDGEMAGAEEFFN